MLSSVTCRGGGPTRIAGAGLIAGLCLTATPALAHTGAGPVSGLAAGFGHPIGGLDHVLAMVAVGVLAAQMGGRALWALPAAFVGTMLLGGMAGVAGLPLPFVELGITGSVIILGAVIALGRRMPLPAAAVLTGAMALFHGHAHGTEMPLSVGGLDYAIGFALATAMLHGLGLALGLGLHQAVARLAFVRESLAPLAVRACGSLIAVAGLGLALA